jgi:hypothetical protein
VRLLLRLPASILLSICCVTPAAQVRAHPGAAQGTASSPSISVFL